MNKNKIRMDKMTAYLYLAEFISQVPLFIGFLEMNTKIEFSLIPFLQSNSFVT